MKSEKHRGEVSDKTQYRYIIHIYVLFAATNVFLFVFHLTFSFPVPALLYSFVFFSLSLHLFPFSFVRHGTNESRDGRSIYIHIRMQFRGQIRERARKVPEKKSGKLLYAKKMCVHVRGFSLVNQIAARVIAAHTRVVDRK